MNTILFLSVVFSFSLNLANARLEQGLFETSFTFKRERYVHFQRSAYDQSHITAKISCISKSLANQPAEITLGVVLRSSPCAKEFFETIGPDPLPQNNDSLRNLKVCLVN